ncbi:MAG: class I SAM-dependent methyltransferase [Planctomycetota bacterium]|jgi:SAM-dependent methyltransferase
MTRWDEIYRSGQWPQGNPSSEAFELVTIAEKTFEERPLRLWDLCCGLGRNTVVMASAGHRAFGSDGSEAAVDAARKRFGDLGLEGRFAVADMTEVPWPDEDFHGVFSWNALHHNTLAKIRTAVSVVHGKLVPGGFILANLLSTRSGRYGKGKELEPNTFLCEEGMETGVTHHFFDAPGAMDLLKDFEVLSLVERRMEYEVRAEGLLNPFANTKWLVLARKAT